MDGAGVGNPLRGFSSRPFAVGSLTGYRSFRIDEDYDLLPMCNIPFAWQPGVNVAQCFKNMIVHYYAGAIGPNREEGHDLVSLGCTCGFYAYFDATGSHANGRTVEGIIKGYGRCVRGDRGFRCEKAEILALVISDGKSVDVDWEAVAGRWSQHLPVYKTLPAAAAEFPLSRVQDYD